jgi:hypothetical protein
MVPKRAAAGVTRARPTEVVRLPGRREPLAWSLPIPVAQESDGQRQARRRGRLQLANSGSGRSGAWRQLSVQGQGGEQGGAGGCSW